MIRVNKHYLEGKLAGAKEERDRIANLIEDTYHSEDRDESTAIVFSHEIVDLIRQWQPYEH